MTASPEFASTLLDPDLHDVSGFGSGEVDLDVWLREHAVTAARARVAQTFVWVAEGGREVVAYYSLSAHAVPRAEAPSRISRGVPDSVPAALLGKLALDRSLHGRRLGDILLADALTRVIDASQSGPAVRAIVVDAATERGRALYVRFGFVAVPGRDDRMIVRAESIARGLRQGPSFDQIPAPAPHLALKPRPAEEGQACAPRPGHQQLQPTSTERV